MNRWSALVGVVAGSLACAGLAAGEPPAIPIGAAPLAGDLVAIAPDLDRVLLARHGDGWQVTLDGQPVVEGAEAVAHVSFLEGGAPLFSYRQDGRWRLWVDHERIGSFDALADQLVTQGGRWAVQAKKGKRWHTVVDGEAGASWEMTSPALFSPGGSHVAWLGQQDGRTVVILDGRELAVAGEAYLKTLGEDGTLVWTAEERGGWRIMVGEARQPGRWTQVAHAAVHEGDWAALARDAAGWWVVHGEERHGPFKRTAPPRFTSDGELIWFEGTDQGLRPHMGGWVGPWVADLGEGSPVEGPSVLWWELGEGEATVYVGDQPVRQVLDVAPPLWYAGDQPAWIGRDAEGWRVFVGAWSTPAWPEIAQAVTSEDGAHVAVVRRDLKSWGMSLFRVGESEPVGDWPGAVGTDFGGGARFVEGALWFSQVQGNQLVRREIPLGGS